MQKTALILLAFLAASHAAHAAGFTARAAGFTGHTGEIRKKIQSNDPGTRAEGYQEIADLDQEERDDALRLLAVEYKKWEKKRGQVAKKIEDLLKGYEKGLDQKEALRKDWEKSAVEAMEIIFDTTVFPTPPGPVNGPYIGYYEVMAKVDAAWELFEKIRGKADKDLKRIRGASRAAAEKMRDELTESEGRLKELGKELAGHGRNPDRLPALSRFHLGMLFLKCGNWIAAARIFDGGHEAPYLRNDGEDGKGKEGNGDFAVEPGPALAGYERTLFFFFYADQVDDYNMAIKMPSTQDERKTVAKNNAYRISLGLCPLQIHPDITRAITDHLNSIPEMSHTGATEETRTVGQRIARTGYRAKGGAGENLATTSLTAAMDGWKWDGGHHRVLVEPGAVHIGVYEKNGCGMNIATGELPDLPVLDYLKHFQ